MAGAKSCSLMLRIEAWMLRFWLREYYVVSWVMGGEGGLLLR